MTRGRVLNLMRVLISCYKMLQTDGPSAGG